MKIQEIYRGGVTDNEDLGDHDRTVLDIRSAVSFAHDPQLRAAFEQLTQMPEFKASLEKGIATVVQSAVAQFVRSSSIPPGHGWTDDYEVDVTISPRDSSVS